MAKEKERVVVTLDWTPNTNHVGFFVAQALGFYDNAGLSVSLLSPHVDDYSSTPSSRLANDTASFALAPSETVISHHLPPVHSSRPKLIAVAAILQQDLSAIATLKGNGITRPRDLDGCKYASYGARFEGRIVQKLIQSDGGKGQFDELTPEKLGIWSTLIAGQADATWIFKGWEGVEAHLRQIELNEFSLNDYGIPYGYSPVVVCCPDTLRNKPELVRAFLECTGRGFVYATSNIEQASRILMDAMSSHGGSSEKLNTVEPDVVLESLKYMAKYFIGASGKWGSMEPSTWFNFLDWLGSNNLLTSLLQSRNPVPGVSASLDELRSGNVGSILKASDLVLEDMFTNSFL